MIARAPVPGHHKEARLASRWCRLGEMVQINAGAIDQLSEKGLREHARAAQIAKVRHPNATFQLLGWEDASPDAVPMAEVLTWQNDGVIQYLGEATDVRPLLAACHVYVPSHHEGMPRSVLEALATGRPILTTDVPGCRETVVVGETPGDKVAVNLLPHARAHIQQCSCRRWAASHTSN